MSRETIRLPEISMKGIRKSAEGLSEQVPPPINAHLRLARVNYRHFNKNSFFSFRMTAKEQMLLIISHSLLACVVGPYSYSQ